MVAASGSWQGCHGQMRSWAHRLIGDLWIQKELCCTQSEVWIQSQVYNFCLYVMQNFDFWVFFSIFSVACDSAETIYLGYVLAVLLKTGILSNLPVNILSNLPENIFSLPPHCYSFLSYIVFFQKLWKNALLKWILTFQEVRTSNRIWLSWSSLKHQGWEEG